MPSVTKEVFLASLECVGLAWMLLRSEGDRELSEADAFYRDQGREVGEFARQAYAGGVFAPPGPAAAALTATILDDASVSTVYEAAFEADGLVARADIMRRGGAGWHLLEVKSGVNDKAELVQDLGYTTMVARRAGAAVSQTSLVLVSAAYRKGMPVDKLFVEVDHSAEVGVFVSQFEDHWRVASAAVLGPNRPAPELGFPCRYCQHFADGCVGQGIPDPLFDLPRLSESKFSKLRELGVERISAIPEDFKLTENQEKVRDAVSSNRPWVSPGLRVVLSEVQWPAYYLDFETTATALPLFADVAPYEQIPTQYSIHVYDALDTERDHREFLADPSTDGRRQLAESLLRDLSDSGSIVVYSGFEKRILNYLGKLYPDLAAQFGTCVDRLVDLEAIIKKHYYHPAFRGRSSIKRTLPVLVPEMSYESLEIGNGADASALFARVARGEKTQAEWKRIRRALLTYCAQDTLAMVQLHRALVRSSNGW